MKDGEREWLYRHVCKALERLTIGTGTSAAELRATAALLRTIEALVRSDAASIEDELALTAAPRVAAGGR